MTTNHTATCIVCRKTVVSDTLSAIHTECTLDYAPDYRKATALFLSMINLSDLDSLEISILQALQSKSKESIGLVASFYIGSTYLRTTSPRRIQLLFAFLGQFHVAASMTLVSVFMAQNPITRQIEAWSNNPKSHSNPFKKNLNVPQSVEYKKWEGNANASDVVKPYVLSGARLFLNETLQESSGVTLNNFDSWL